MKFTHEATEACEPPCCPHAEVEIEYDLDGPIDLIVTTIKEDGSYDNSARAVLTGKEARTIAAALELAAREYEQY